VRVVWIPQHCHCSHSPPSASTAMTAMIHPSGRQRLVLMADIVTAVHEVGETDVDTVGIRSKDHMQWLRAVDDSGKTVFFQPFIPGIQSITSFDHKTAED